MKQGQQRALAAADSAWRGDGSHAVACFIAARKHLTTSLHMPPSSVSILARIGRRAKTVLEHSPQH